LWIVKLLDTNMNIPFYVPWITEEDKDSVMEALNSRWLTGGPKAHKFEKQFAAFIGVKHAVSVNSGTAALHLALRALNLKPGDEVIVPVLTFAATANTVLYCGVKPIFADVDSKTFNLSTESVLGNVTKRTKVIIVVHYGGQPADMKEIMEIAEDHRLCVIEDCAHSLGASYRKSKTGRIGTIGCFSFYPTKIITTLEGGMLTTNEESIANKAKLLREHGMTRSALEREKRVEWYYDITDLGYNYRLNEVQAALGLSQLKRVEDGIKKRVEAARYYARKLSGIVGIVTPYEAENRTHVYHLYVIKVLEEKCGLSRDELFRKLSKNGIGLSVHYTPLHLMTFYKRISSYGAASFPNAEEVYKQVLSLPLFPTLSRDQIDYVVDSIKHSIS
jgi:UDP-4-amino-4,6-dideoxy-N-acetyl-beta-L-altrosamine transaminase